MNEISELINTSFTTPDLLNIKYLNNKCKLLIIQIDELKHNYQEMLMNRYNKEYTFIDGSKLTHVQPYKSNDVDNVNICKAICSKDKNCYGLNVTSNNLSLFNNNQIHCDFIPSDRNTKKLARLKLGQEMNNVYIKITDENLETTRKLIERLVNEFQSTCNRNMEIIGSMETFTPNMNTLGTINKNNTVIYGLKQEMSDQQETLLRILNDVQIMGKEYGNSSLSVNHNNVMLSVYTIMIIILIIIIIKINIGI